MVVFLGIALSAALATTRQLLAHQYPKEAGFRSGTTVKYAKKHAAASGFTGQTRDVILKHPKEIGYDAHALTKAVAEECPAYYPPSYAVGGKLGASAGAGSINPFHNNPNWYPGYEDSFTGHICLESLAFVTIDVFGLLFSVPTARNTVSPDAVRAMSHIINPFYKNLREPLRMMASGGSVMARAQGVFDFGKLLWSGGLWSALFKEWKKSLDWWSLILIGTSGVVTIGAAFATGGASEIVVIAGMLVSATYVVTDATKAYNACFP